MAQRIGIMGGTFDPIHIGHLILAQNAAQQLGLDKVLFIPAGNPPHKKDRIKLATDEQRLLMVELAVKSNPMFVCDDREMRKKDYSYSYQTLEELKAENPYDKFYFIIGEDSLINFHTWMKPELIVKNAAIVAADRPDFEPEKMNEVIESNRKKFGGEFILIDCPDIQLSSHEIRSAVKEGKSIRYYVPDAVFSYIEENGLYR